MNIKELIPYIIIIVLVIFLVRSCDDKNIDNKQIYIDMKHQRDSLDKIIYKNNIDIKRIKKENDSIMNIILKLKIDLTNKKVLIKKLKGDVYIKEKMFSDNKKKLDILIKEEYNKTDSAMLESLRKKLN